MNLTNTRTGTKKFKQHLQNVNISPLKIITAYLIPFYNFYPVEILSYEQKEDEDRI